MPYVLRCIFACLCVGMAIFPRSAHATYSIIACEPGTRTCGCAVATNNLAVGASVCYARAGVGVLVSQFETNPNYGPEGLRRLAEGRSPESVLEYLLANDDNFEGQGTEARQVTILSVDGRIAVHLGAATAASPWAGSRRDTDDLYALQGNGLAGEHVLAAMEEAFLKAEGTLAERLMAALRAGERAGGQRTGGMSAALLVRTPAGWPLDIDLRVDAAERPVEDLDRLLDLYLGRQAIIRAEQLVQRGDTTAAWTSVAEALQRGASWDRIWMRAAQFAIRLDEPERALEYLAVFMALNPKWAAEEVRNERYLSLKGNRLFESWQERRP